jgi:enamine deaminase RidA (YjgF/YER057c/UK114 family)
MIARSSDPVVGQGIRLAREVVTPRGHWAWKGAVGAPHALKIGNVVYIGGQLSLDGNGDLLGAGDIEIQTRNAFQGMVDVLAAAGTSMQELMKLHTYYVYGGEGSAVTEYWEKMTRVRLGYLANPGPAATALRVSGVPTSDLLIGIDGIAVIGGDKRRIMPAGSWDWSMPTPFSQGWRIGNRIFTGGQISADSKGRATAVGDVEAQTENILEFLRRVLREGGGDWKNLVTLKVCFRCSGSADEARALNERILDVVRRTIPEPRPALTAFGIDLVYEGLALEIDEIAILDDAEPVVPAGIEAPSFAAGFAHAWRSGAEVYFGGISASEQVGLRTQAETALANLRRILAAAASGATELVKVTAFFVADRDDRAGARGHETLTGVLGSLSSPGPVVTMVQVPALPEAGQLFQIDGIAVRR